MKKKNIFNVFAVEHEHHLKAKVTAKQNFMFKIAVCIRVIFYTNKIIVVGKNVFSSHSKCDNFQLYTFSERKTKYSTKDI